MPIQRTNKSNTQSAPSAPFFYLALIVGGALIFLATRTPLGLFVVEVGVCAAGLCFCVRRFGHRRPTADVIRASSIIPIMETMPHIAWIETVSGSIAYSNESFKTLCDETRCSLRGQRPISGGEREALVYTASGTVFLYRVTHSADVLLEGRDSGKLYFAYDVTAQHTNDRYRLLTSKVFDASSEGIVVTESNGAIIASNHAVSTITGYTEEELQGSQLRVLHAKESHAAVDSAIVQSQNGHHSEIETTGLTKDQKTYPLMLRLDSIKDENENVIGLIGIYTDHTENKRRESQILALANYDHLTGLPNRRTFVAWAETTLERCAQTQSSFAVLFVDLDRFKTINDSAGHSTGDQLLRVIADRLQQAKPDDCILARMGGDEFLAGIPVREGRSFEEEAKRILSIVAEPIRIGDSEFVFSASVGMAEYPRDGTTVDELIMNADMAMYEAKAKGMGRLQIFSSEINKRKHFENELSVYLKSANANEFFVRYQPKVILETGEICGFEALVRWNHPTYGEISPGMFIHIAEENGCIGRIGHIVLVEVCKQINRWGDMAKPVAINASAIQIKHPDFVQELLATIDAYSVPRRLIEVEITESVLVSDNRETARKLQELRDQGIRIALDDFGTGYSSLSYLTNLSFDSLKIDRSFVSKIGTCSKNSSIFEFLVNLSNELNVTLIAEGVETEDHITNLTTYGCRVGQGYYFGKPMPAADATLLLTTTPIDEELCVTV